MVNAARIEFGAYLSHRRLQAGFLTQQELADTLNHTSGSMTLTRHEVSRWERGIRIPDDWLPVLARLFGLDTDAFERAATAARQGLSHPLVARAAATTARDLDTARASTELPADDGLEVAWDEKGLLQLLEVWASPMLHRRTFLTISGLALTRPAWQALDLPTPALPARDLTEARVADPLLNLIDDVVVRAQKLDEQQGGAAADFVADQFASVGRLLRVGSYDAPSGRRLAAAAAQLAQTAGFMSYEAGHDGHAQRWYLTGLRAAHAAGDFGLSASILGLMSNHAVSLGLLQDASQLAAAATEAANHAPPLVRALLTARGSLSCAASGDIAGFRRAREATLEQLDRHVDADEPAPRWADYATPTELDAIAGRGLVILAHRVPTRHRTLLTEAEGLLQARAHTDASEQPQRSALRHGAWLGLAYARSGDLDKAVTAGRQALSKLPTVTSGRSLRLLRRLQHELVPYRSQSSAVSRFLADSRPHLGPSRGRRAANEPSAYE